ncbi:MAG: hypothetical protein HAW59_02230 [Betaproteobacteria bacterium]|nr:hypothetical protein [Betaproteobacteria bacterium]
MPPAPSAVLYFSAPHQWRKWLENNFQTASEAWFLFPKKASGKKGISYNDAVEAALCFGWIDSIVRAHDSMHTKQRFTPRNPKSTYSQTNIERLRFLLAQNLAHPSIAPALAKIAAQQFSFPADITAAIKKDADAWRHYQKFSGAYRRIRAAYIDSARARPEEFQKRLENFIKKTGQGKQFGYGGIEKYF